MSEAQIRATIASCCEELDRRRRAERTRSRRLVRLLLPAIASLTLGASGGDATPDASPAATSKPDAAQVSDSSIDAGEAIAMYSAPGCGC